MLCIRIIFIGYSMIQYHFKTLVFGMRISIGNHSNIPEEFLVPNVGAGIVRALHASRLENHITVSSTAGAMLKGCSCTAPWSQSRSETSRTVRYLPGTFRNLSEGSGTLICRTSWNLPEPSGTLRCRGKRKAAALTSFN